VPNVLELEHADEYPRAMVEQMREFGLFAATIPEEYGGLGLGASAYVRIVEAIARAWMSLTGVVNTHLMVAELVRRYGTDEQRAHFLPLLAAAELRGGLALTEPDCGTDLQAVRTTATRVDGGYVLRGTKMWITNAHEGNCLAVLTKTDVDAEPRHRGMSLFVVPKALGYSVTRKLGKLGYKGIDTCEVVFDDVFVPDDHLLGGVEGHGFHQAVGALELGRINIAARGVGVADAALRASLAYAQQRHTMGKPIVEHQAIASKLADMACRVESARLLTHRAAGAFDRGERCDMEAGMAKLVASEAALENATEALRIHGAYGYSTEDHVERYYRDAPLLCIGEGTNEIQRITIAKQLVARAASTSP
jgi:alkylation response protein AidB-like acyl-CoA dehydrogenase